MKKSTTKTVVIIFASLALLIAVAGGVLLFFAMQKEFDASIRHFKIDSIFAASACAVCVGGFVIACAGFFSVPRKKAYGTDGKNSFIMIFISVFAALMCGLYFGYSVKNGLPADSKKGLILAEVSFAALSAIYFIVRALGLASKKKAVNIAEIVPAFLSAFLLLNVYFNTSDPLNAPLKIYEIVMLVSFMLFFTAEAGISIERPSMTGKYIFSGLFAVSSGGMVAISRVASRVVSPDSFNYDIIKVCLYAVLWLFILISFVEKILKAREIEANEAFFDNEAAAADADGDAADDAEDDAADEAEDTADEIEEASEEDSENAEDGVEEAVEEAEEAVEEAEEAADDAADDAVQAPEELEEAAEEAKDTADDIFEKVKAEAEKATAAASEAEKEE